MTALAAFVSMICLAAPPQETRYLAFQMFTGSAGDGKLMRELLFPSADATAFVKDLASRIGTVGRGARRLAVIFGPLAFDNSDAEVRRLIDSAFTVALQQNVAVGFHIDDSMFWGLRKDLVDNPANVEWLDWEGTPNTGRRLDWSAKPTKIMPQLCFNSPDVMAAVRERAALIGRAIEAGRSRLRLAGKGELFAGVIAGWETMIGQDFDTGRYLGYRALSNLGFSKSHRPSDLDTARERVVHAFIALWATGLADAGVPREKIYCHTAFLARRGFSPSTTETYSQHNHFAPPSVSYGNGCRPGFSTYPEPGHFDQIYTEEHAHGDPSWASSEGTNLQLGAGPGQSGMNMETYLGRMFNHGAVLVNVFSWDLGGEANKNMDFRVVTEGPEALAAYRKFLNGESLVEAAETTTIMERLPAKIHRIQAELPAWIQKAGGQARAEPLMHSLDAALKANDLHGAEKVADQILELIEKG